MNINKVIFYEQNLK